MDPLGCYLFSREELIGKTAHDMLASKKEQDAVSTTFAFPPASSDALSTASAIAGILHGHYNADGTRRSNQGDFFQMGSSASGLQLQQQLNGANVAGVSSRSRAVRADDVPSNTGSSVMPTFSKSIAAAPSAQVDELSVRRSLMKFDRELILNHEQHQHETVDVPTLTFSVNTCSQQHDHDHGKIEAPGHAASFPWDVNVGVGNCQHLKQAKVLPVKGPATVTKSKLLKLKLGDIAAMSSVPGILNVSKADCSGLRDLFEQIGHSKASASTAKPAPTKKKKTTGSTWTKEEDEIFLSAVKLHGSKWSKVADLISSK